MSTQVFQPPALPAHTIEVQRLRGFVLVTAIVTASFAAPLVFGSLGSGADHWLVMASGAFWRTPIVLMWVWWRLSTGDTQLPVGLAMGYCAEQLYRVIALVLAGTPRGIELPFYVRAFRPLAALLFLLVLGLAIMVIQSSKAPRQLVVRGAIIGLLLNPFIVFLFRVYRFLTYHDGWPSF